MSLCNNSTNEGSLDGFRSEILQKPLQKESKCRPTKSTLIAGGFALALIFAIGTLITLYFTNPAVHNLFNSAFTHLQNNQLTVAQGLLYVALPVAGASLCIGLLIHIIKRHKERNEYNAYTTKEDETFFQGLKTTMEEMQPTRKQMIITALALVILACLSVGAYFLFRYVPSAHQFLHNTVLAGLQHKIQLWQALAYMGGGSAATALILGVAYCIIARACNMKQTPPTFPKKPENKEWNENIKEVVLPNDDDDTKIGEDINQSIDSI